MGISLIHIIVIVIGMTTNSYIAIDAYTKELKLYYKCQYPKIEIIK